MQPVWNKNNQLSIKLSIKQVLFWINKVVWISCGTDNSLVCTLSSAYFFLLLLNLDALLGEQKPKWLKDAVDSETYLQSTKFSYLWLMSRKR